MTRTLEMESIESRKGNTQGPVSFFTGDTIFIILLFIIIILFSLLNWI